MSEAQLVSLYNAERIVQIGQLLSKWRPFQSDQYPNINCSFYMLDLQELYDCTRLKLNPLAE